MNRPSTGKSLTNTKQRQKIFFLFVVLGILLIVVSCIDLIVALDDVSSLEFIKAIFGKSENKFITYIIQEVRIPRLVTAILVGSGLSVAGLILQTLFHNPLAGPYVLGISSGAGLGVALYVMASTAIIGLAPVFSAGGQIIAAMLGALAIFFLILSFSWRLNDTVSLLIIGIMIGGLASSVVGILQYFASSESVHKYVIWSLGSLSATGWLYLKFIIPVYFISIFLAVLIIKPMDALLLGEMHAKVAGVNVKTTRIIMVLTASLLAGVLTAFTGPIAFVGMTVPHIVRLMTGSVSHKIILPGVILSGALLLIICDIISQLPGKASSLPINGVTALFGAPVVVALILKSRRIKATF